MHRRVDRRRFVNGAHARLSRFWHRSKTWPMSGHVMFALAVLAVLTVLLTVVRATFGF
jgi:hypothetical protein